MRAYAQLTQEQRYQIHAFMKAGFTQSAIGHDMRVHKSTISRELKRNRGYRPKQAEAKAMQRRHEKPKTRIPLTTRVLVEDRIKQDWSPEQISGRLFMEQGVSISHEWIYLPIYRDKHQGGDLHKHLRCQKNGASVMASRIAGDASPTASALMTAPLSQTINPASVTGKAIPSSARVTGASSPLLWNAKLNTPF